MRSTAATGRCGRRSAVSWRRSRQGGQASARQRNLAAETAVFSRHAARELTGLLEARVSDLPQSNSACSGSPPCSSFSASRSCCWLARNGVTLPLARLECRHPPPRQGRTGQHPSRPPSPPRTRSGRWPRRSSSSNGRASRSSAWRPRLAACAPRASASRRPWNGIPRISGIRLDRAGLIGASAAAMRTASDGMAGAVEQTRAGAASTAAGAEESSAISPAWPPRPRS